MLCISQLFCAGSAMPKAQHTIFKDNYVYYTMIGKSEMFQKLAAISESPVKLSTYGKGLMSSAVKKP